jgi:hypothetical protein
MMSGKLLITIGLILVALGILMKLFFRLSEIPVNYETSEYF